MQVIHTIAEFREWRGRSPAGTAAPFVPTMGALHEGHLSLVRHARAMDATHAAVKVIASIFVNPTQFGPNEDFAKYPRTLDADLAMLQSAGCDAVFVPSAKEMYPQPATQHSALSTSIDPGPIANILEGAIRPGHFRGVCTVVAKLLNITSPTHLLLGQKDFQQQAVLRQMCADLNFGAEVVTLPTVREADGLAMSSRNRYLPAELRPKAPAIYETLLWAKSAIENGQHKAAILENEMHVRLASGGLVPQYSAARNPVTLAEFPLEITLPCVLLVAAKLGNTRLIDNLLLPKDPNSSQSC